MEAILSIIVPAYNVEQYLSDCLDSVVKQDNGKLEIVLVNDGSTDSTWDLCQRYAEKYPYIHAYSKENGGLSAARNFGIQKATGQYVYFLDSDDFLKEEAVEKLLSKIEKGAYDVVVSLYENLEDATGEKYDCGYHLEQEKVESLSGEALLQYVMTGRVYDWYAVLQTVKKSYLEANNLYFEEGVTFEDARWTPRVLLHAEKVGYLDFPVYVYRRNRAGSITGTFSEKNFKSKLGVFTFIEDFAKQNGLSDKTRDMMLANMSNLYVSALFDTWSFPKEQRKAYLQVLKKYKLILANSARSYHHLLNMMWNVAGITPVSYLLYLRAGWVRKRNK